jgi:hypothetical protein
MEALAPKAKPFAGAVNMRMLLSVDDDRSLFDIAASVEHLTGTSVGAVFNPVQSQYDALSDGSDDLVHYN